MKTHFHLAVLANYSKQLDKLCSSALPSLQTLFLMCIFMCKCDAVWENKILDLNTEMAQKSYLIENKDPFVLHSNTMAADVLVLCN